MWVWELLPLPCHAWTQKHFTGSIPKMWVEAGVRHVVALLLCYLQTWISKALHSISSQVSLNMSLEDKSLSAHHFVVISLVPCCSLVGYLGWEVSGCLEEQGLSDQDGVLVISFFRNFIFSRIWEDKLAGFEEENPSTRGELSALRVGRKLLWMLR